ncbi:MAG TPA: hypothetical protein VE800_07790 [Actinomycetota bacterium]|nr:hypothetical protein [Actinomycetota bacterium]
MDAVRRTRLRPVAGGLCVLAALAACAAPEYKYVRNTEARTAFRVPTPWTVFDEAQISGVDPATDTPDNVDWLVGIDGDPAPQLGHVFPASYATDHPQGVAAVLTLTGESRDQANLGALRNLIIPVDQIRDEVGTDAVRILSYDDMMVRDGYRGLQMVVQVQASALAGDAAVQDGDGGPGFLASDYVQLNQIALLDASTEHAYVLALLCSADCYARNRSDIESAIDSWTVLP